MGKFKIGDRVRYTGERWKGEYGTVISVGAWGYDYAVEFDKPDIAKHNASGRGKLGYCWYCHEKDMKRGPKFKIGDRVIVVQGKTIPHGLNWIENMDYTVGETYTIIDIVYLGNEDSYIYTVDGVGYNYNESWLRFASKESSPEKEDHSNRKKPKRRIVIEVDDDGAFAKYINGKTVEKTAAVKRYYTDEPNDFLAAVNVIDKLSGGKLADMTWKDLTKYEMEFIQEYRKALWMGSNRLKMKDRFEF